MTESIAGVTIPDTPLVRDITAEILDAEASARPVTWLSLDPLVPLGSDGSDSVQDVPVPGWLVEEYQQRGVFAVLGARTFGPGASGRLLARAHPSGQWTQWLEPAGHGTRV